MDTDRGVNDEGFDREVIFSRNELITSVCNPQSIVDRVKHTRTLSAAPIPPKAAAIGERRCIGTKTENTAALTFWVNVNVRRTVALGPRRGFDGPESSPDPGVPRVPSVISPCMIVSLR
jgi:hypothetical protein